MTGFLREGMTPDEAEGAIDYLRAALSACQQDKARLEHALTDANGAQTALKIALSACQEELALTAIPTLKLVESYKCMRDRAEIAEDARDELARVGHRVLILDDAEPGEVSEAHVAVIGELRAALSSEATKETRR